MKCLECEDMACRVFYHRTEQWEGFCTNSQSPRYHTPVTGESGCNIVKDKELLKV